MFDVELVSRILWPLDHVGKKLKKERLRQGLSQEQLADKMNLPKSSVWWVESGKATRLEPIQRQAEALGLVVYLHVQRMEDMNLVDPDDD